MHDHGEILALAAAAIDFELDPVERSRLRTALEECALCRRQATAMRATATILSRPSDIGTPSRVRDVVIGAALRGGRRAPALRSLLLAGLSILVVLGGTVFIAGNRGFGLIDTAPSASIPVPTAVAHASPSASSSPTRVPPSATQPPTPSPSPTVPVATLPPLDTGPLRAGEIAAMVTDGRLVIRTKPGTSADSAIFKTKLHPGQRVVTLEGPVDASGYPWFRVRLGVIEGWVAAASLSGEPWLAPVRNGPIAFVGDAGDGLGEAIYTVDAGGTSGETLVFADPRLSRYAQLTWSPDGRRLAFVASPVGSVNRSTEVYVIDADGSNLVRITENEVDDDSPAWSPDGTKLAVRVTQVDSSAPVDSNVVVTPVDGPGVTVLGPGANPVWSPDGLELAMTVTENGASHLWVQAPDGDGRRQVSDVAVASAPPSWSPDGQLLLVSSGGLSVVDVASGSVTRLTAEPATLPTWSIGGTIAFTTAGAASPGVFVIESDGTGLKRVAEDLIVSLVPEWSPDGLRLLLGNETPGSAIVNVDPASGSVTALGRDDIAKWSPAWEPRLP